MIHHLVRFAANALDKLINERYESDDQDTAVQHYRLRCAVQKLHEVATELEDLDF
jgi:hypothetical protein